MAKTHGLNSRLLVDEFDLSGDTQQLNRIGGGPAVLDVTGINKSAHERLGGLLDGGIDWTSFFNPASDQAHPVLSALPTADTIVSYFHGVTIGAAAASLTAKQVNYDGTRGNDGMFTFDLQALANGDGLAWGLAGTAGLITETTTGDQTSIDHGEATTDGLRAFIHVSAFSGTDATVVVQESSDDFSADTGAAIASFTSITGVGAEAISVAGAVEQYLRVSVTVDNFTSMTFAVNIARGLG